MAPEDGDPGGEYDYRRGYVDGVNATLQQVSHLLTPQQQELVREWFLDRLLQWRHGPERFSVPPSLPIL